jgi:SAM-dependent methyltransferase
VRIAPEELAAIYRCPRCRLALTSLKCAGCGSQFESVQQIPVLVDFAESVLVERETLGAAASLVPRQEVRSSSLPHPQVAANLNELSSLLPASSRVLVVGGGEDAHGLAQITDRSDLVTITFDIYASALTDFVADAHSIPLPDESVDCVVIQAVLEHVLNPWQVAEELFRVLRPGGIVYAETPFMQQVHEGAYDFTRFTESGHRWLFRKFEMIDSGSIGGPVLVLAWTSVSLLRALKAPAKMQGAVRRLLTWLSRRVDKGLNRRINADSASAVYFMGRKASETYEMSRADIIDFYARTRS